MISRVQNYGHVIQRLSEETVVEYLKEGEWMPFIYFMLLLPSYKVIWYPYILITFYEAVLLFWQTGLLVKTFELDYFLQYSPFYFIEGFMTVSGILWLAYYKTYIPLLRIFKNNCFWSFTGISSDTKLKILRERRNVQILYGIQILLAEFLLLINLYRWNCEKTKYFAISQVIAKHFPEYLIYFQWITMSIGNTAFLTMVSSIWYTLYISIYLKFQVFMLIDRIEKIAEDLNKESSLHSVDNKIYQRKVTMSLKFFIHRHQKILEAHRVLSNKGAYLNFWLFLSSLLVSLYSTFIIFSEHYNWFVRFLAFFTFSFTITSVSYQGQLHENSGEMLAKAMYNLHWNLWDVQNMKMYWIFYLYVSSRTVKLPFPSYLDCNFTLLKWFIKFTYSIANIFYSSRNRRN